MMIKYINLEAEYEEIRDEIMEVTDRIFCSGRFILGEEVDKVEKLLAEKTGAAEVISLNSGFDALRLTLRSLGIGAGDEIIVPSYTFVASVSAIVENGASPVFVDIGKDLNMDPQQIEKLITSKTRAILPVHLSGRPCNMNSIKELALRHDLLVVEDAAQAFGSSLEGRSLGRFGVAGCFSLHPLKSLSVPGDGGFVLTDSDSIASDLRALRNHGRSIKAVEVLGVNSRLDALHAAVLRVKLKHFPRWSEQRRKVALWYQNIFEDIPGLRVLKEEKGANVVWSTFPLISAHADRLERDLLASEIEVFRHFREPIHRMKYFADRDVKLPTTERLCSNVVYLPIHPFLSEEDVNQITNVIKKSLYV